MAVTSDASPFTSVTASPMDSHDADQIPIELKVPLPSSSTCSDKDEESGNSMEEASESTYRSQMGQENGIHLGEQQGKSEGLADTNAAGSKLEEGPHEPPFTLTELAHLARLEAFQRDQLISAQCRMDELRLSCGIAGRLISTSSIAYGNMIDQFKTDDQAGFAGLYEACEQLCESCVMASDSATSCSQSTWKAPAEPDGHDDRSAFQMLPPAGQEHILNFLTRIRVEPDYLSERISALTPTELIALTATYHPAGIDFSILQNHSHGKSQYFSRDSQMMKLSRRMDNLHHFHNQDPFFALLYGIFDCSARYGSPEYIRRQEVWSTTCARTMTEGFGGSRPGSDEFAIASLDAFSNNLDWPLKTKLETYLMQTLVAGAFLLEGPPSQPVDFKESPETNNARAAIAEADFFEDALTGLFQLLATQGFQRAIPSETLSFAHAVLAKIEDVKLRLRAQQFIMIRWYFATFISSVVVYPEICGIMMTQHIGESARRLILQKLVVKLQEQVFDVMLPWNHHALIKPEIRDGIMAIFRLFEPPAPKEPVGSASDIEDENASTRFILLSPLDITGLVQTLCPERLPDPSRTESASAGNLSDRPSTAGSSTLVAGSSDVGSAMPALPGGENVEPKGTYQDTVTGSYPEDKKTSVTIESGPRTVAKSPVERVSKDWDSQLRSTSQQLRNIHGRNHFSNLKSSFYTWSSFYYPSNGQTLSTKPVADTARHRDPEASSAGPKPYQDSDINNPDQSYEAVKAAVLELILQHGDLEANYTNVDTSTDIDSHRELRDPLEILIDRATETARLEMNFDRAHSCWKNLQGYRTFLEQSADRSYRTLFEAVNNDLHAHLDLTAKVAKQQELDLRSLQQLQSHQKRVLTRMEQTRKALRVKMWYISDVRHSASYEGALHVTRALRTMASARKPKPAGSIANWARQRLRGSNVHDRAEAQTLEAMVAPKEHGGLSKLADEQVGPTAKWLTHNSIENFCKGEERLLRFCFEIHKSVGKIAGNSLLESPVLWSSHLFRRERNTFDVQRPRPGALGGPWPLGPPPNLGVQDHHPDLRYSTHNAANLPSRISPAARARSPPSSTGGFWKADQGMGTLSGLGLYASQPHLPPTPTSPPPSWSGHPFSPTTPLYRSGPALSSAPSPTVGHLRGNSEDNSSPAKKTFAKQIKKILCSLLVSDLGYLLWNQGSETDAWTNDLLGTQQRAAAAIISPTSANENPRVAETESDIQNNSNQAPSSTKLQASSQQFPPASLPEDHISSDKGSRGPFPFFAEAFATILNQMALTHDPYVKLQSLYDLESLVLKYISSQQISSTPGSSEGRPLRRDGNTSLRGRSIPRTKATSLEEVIANCTERRAGTLRSKDLNTVSAVQTAATKQFGEGAPETDEIVNVLLSIFRDPKFRPNTLFRDLQYIAAFVPTDILDQTAQGKAFWDAGLAALALKEELCESVIQRANQITAYHILPHSSEDPVADTTLASTTLQDAARLWLITAKEGSPIAARELGLFYLTQPELLPRVTMPLSLGKDVFKSAMSADLRTGEKERGRLDPYTFATVFHWMEVAANGGDKDAKDFLKGNGELSGAR